MTQKNDIDGMNLVDPFGFWRSVRDANLDVWAKAMTNLVNTEAYAQAQGAYLDSYLALIGPVQKAVEQYLEESLARLQMPTREDVLSIAERMTNIEMRLDDLDARTDQMMHMLRSQAPVIVEMVEEHMDRMSLTNGKPRAEGEVVKVEDHLRQLDERTDQILNMLQTLHNTPISDSKARSSRKKAAKVDETPPSAAEQAEDRAMEGFENAAS